MLACFYWFYSVLQICAYFPFPRVYFVGATSLVLQQQLSPFLHVYIRSLAAARFDGWL